MGAIICEYDLETQNKLYDFGIDLGLLFQIQDDIIDETQSSEEAGKTTQNDGSKNSFVNLLGLEGAIKSANDLALKCTNTLNTFDLNLKESLEELLLKYINRHK
jgi:farnesyl diphosphate synthase